MKNKIEKIIKKHDLYEQLEALLSLEDNFDDDNSEGYKDREDFVYDSLKYISKLENKIKKNSKIKNLNSPEILPGLEGSIDFYWEEQSCELLMNVSRNKIADYTLFDKNKDKIISKGKL